MRADRIGIGLGSHAQLRRSKSEMYTPQISEKYAQIDSIRIDAWTNMLTFNTTTT